MTNLPQFIRFDNVDFHFKTLFTEHAPAIPIAEKCQSVVNYLQQLKLNDSNLIHFNGVIDRNNRSHFSDHSLLLDHLRNELLPICGSSRRYKFEIYCFSADEDEMWQIELPTQILQVPQIGCSSNVDIILHERRKFTTYQHAMQFQFLIEPISNWLHRNCDGIEENSKDRFLRICSSSSNFLCAQELIDHLKKVTIYLPKK